MSLETGTYISDLVATNPAANDPKSEGDDHIRLLKSVILATFPNFTGEVSITQAEANILDGATVTTAEVNILDGATVTTAELNILDGATVTFTELNILDGATVTTAELNTLDGITSTTAELNILDGATLTTAELNYVTGVTSSIQTQLNAKANLSGAVFTGPVTTPAGSTITGYAPLASPALTGTPTAPTAATATDTTQIATTEFVQNVAMNTALPDQTGNAGKFVKTDGTDATWEEALEPTDIGVTVQGYDADTAKLDADQSWTGHQTFKEVSDTVYSLTGTALDPGNGGVQTKTITGNTTFTDSLTDGQLVELILQDGDLYTITWPTTTWISPDGDTAPTLTGEDQIIFEKVGSTLYGKWQGSFT